MDKLIRSLTEEDVTLLRDIAAAHRSRSSTTTNRPRTDIEDLGARDVFVALTPVGGIPGADSSTLGSATCDIYTLPRPTDSDILLPEILDGVDKVVYNLSKIAVVGGEFIPVMMGRAGHWLVAGAALVDNDPDDDTQRTDCNLASIQAGDCLLATGEGQSILMTYTGGGHWEGTISFVYPDEEVGTGTDSGLLDFYYAAGTLHLLLDGKELLRCGNSCWTGSEITGHVNPSLTGTGTSTSTGTGSLLNGPCRTLPCGTGVASILTGSTIATTGCYTGMPATLSFNCQSDGGGGHYWVLYIHPFICGHVWGATSIFWDTGPRMVFAFTNPSGIITEVNADDGWACNPFSAYFSINDGAGNAFDLSVTG